MDVPLEKMDEYARQFVANLPHTAGTVAHTVGLSGELGAGKTTFVQHVARALGVKEQATSPTFVIAQRHSTAHPVFTTLIHVDAYRLEGETKDTFGFSEYVKNPHALIFVEWPERVPSGLPAGAPVLQFKTVDEYTRNIT